MVLLFIEEGDRSLRSGVPSEPIRPGNLISKDGDAVSNATATSGVDGIALRPQNAWWGAHHSEDYRPALKDFTYTGDDLERMPYYPLGDEGAVYVRSFTPDDDGSGKTAPNITHDTRVGVIDEYPGRVVEEGYSADFTDDSTSNPTTFNEENGNFEPLGEPNPAAPDVPQTEFDSLVHYHTIG